MRGDRLEWEALVASIRAELPEPVEQEITRDGAVVFVGGQPGQVVVRVTASVVSVAEYGVEWLGPDEVVVRPLHLGSLRWRRLPEIQALTILSSLVSAARQSRLSKYRACRLCLEPTPPERLQDDDICEACTHRHPDIT